LAIKNLKQGKNFKYIDPVNIYDCEIGDDVTIGGGSVLTKDISESGVYACNPVKKIK